MEAENKNTPQTKPETNQSGAILLFANGVFFLLLAVWFFSGALVPPKNVDGVGPTFLLVFRKTLPLVAAAVCFAWGWQLKKGRRSL
jgi:hypothetical protein